MSRLRLNLPVVNKIFPTLVYRKITSVAPGDVVTLFTGRTLDDVTRHKCFDALVAKGVKAWKDAWLSVIVVIFIPTYPALLKLLPNVFNLWTQ